MTAQLASTGCLFSGKVAVFVVVVFVRSCDYELCRLNALIWTASIISLVGHRVYEEAIYQQSVPVMYGYKAHLQHYATALIVNALIYAALTVSVIHKEPSFSQPIV